MEVIKYLNKKAVTLYCEGALEALTSEFGIKVTHNEEYDLYILNYSQIDSPKIHPIVTECRSLVVEFLQVGDLNIPEFSVVSRSFDRFLNLGENGNEDKIDITKMKAYEKLDGSLIGLFYYDGKWLYRTKSMIMPTEDMEIDAFGTKWKDKIEEALGSEYIEEIDIRMKNFFNNKTLILEFTSPYNRIVTQYQDTSITLLAIRDNNTGEYIRNHLILDKTATNCGWKIPNYFEFNSVDKCKEVVASLPDLQEGFVLYDEFGVPKCKLKNSLYLAIHRLRGECTPTPKRIMDLVFTNETDEYLTYFPEDKYLFEPYINAYEDCYVNYCELEGENRHIESQKDFTLVVKDTPVAPLLFQKRQNKDLKFKQMFDKLNNNAKYKMVEKYLNEY